MGAYSKLIGSLVGSIAGGVLAHFSLPAALTSPEAIAAITAIVGALGTFFAPANKPAS